MKKILTLCAALLLFAQASVAAAPPEELAIMTPEVMPVFGDGTPNSFLFWLNGHMEYPKKAVKEKINGTVTASFIIEKNGALTNIEILESNYEPFSKEVLSALKQSPRWKPGRRNGDPVRTRMSLPVTFRLPDYEPDLTPPEDKGDVMPKFMGGDAVAFSLWLHREVRYPEEAVKMKLGEEKVIVSFVVDETGKVTDIEVVNKCSSVFSDEVVRVMQRAPKWTPGFQKGLPVKVRYSIPTTFGPQ